MDVFLRELDDGHRGLHQAQSAKHGHYQGHNPHVREMCLDSCLFLGNGFHTYWLSPPNLARIYDCGLILARYKSLPDLFVLHLILYFPPFLDPWRQGVYGVATP